MYDSNFKTIPQTAALGFMPLYKLRELRKRGELPGFCSGNRFYVDTVALKGMLEDACRANQRSGEYHSF